MLCGMEDLNGYAISATDSGVGHAKEFNFDEKAWIARYFVVAPGRWLSNRNVLIAPIAVGKPSGSERVLPVSLTGEKTVGVPAAFEFCQQFAAAGCRVANIDMHGEPVSLHLETLWDRNVAIPMLFKTAAANNIEPVLLIFHRIKLADDETFGNAAKIKALKMIISPPDGGHTHPFQIRRHKNE